MTIEQKVLKGVLLLRNFNTYSTKEAQLADLLGYVSKGYLTESDIDDWIQSLKEELAKTPEQREAEAEERLQWELDCEAEEAAAFCEAWRWYDDGCPSATGRDYSPSNPWDAPGMSVRDFI